METPGKVMALVATAVASMMFLFLVSSTNASFESTLAQSPLPEISFFEGLQQGTDTLVAVTGLVVESYLVEPVIGAVDSYGQALASAWNSSSDTLAFAVGLNQGSELLQVAMQSEPRVAGAYIEQEQSQGSKGFSVDTLYSILIQ